MVSIHSKFVVDDNSKKKAVIVTLQEWERLMDDLSELEDIRAYDQAKAKKETVIPFETAVREIRARNRK